MERDVETIRIQCPSCGHTNIQGADRCEECLHSLMERDLPRHRKEDNLQRMMMTAPISDLLTGKDLLVAKPTDSVEKIVKIFQQKKKSCVLIYEHKRLKGIVSNRDLMLKVAGKQSDLAQVKVMEVMTPNPEYVRADAPIAYVLNIMALGGFRHVPVLAQDGTPLSIISIQDVLAYLMDREPGGAA
jgi:CBS domain-containing protein